MSGIISSSSNKKLLWDLMYENGTFNGISETKFVDVKNIFERVVQTVDTSNSSETTTQKNKQVLVSMLDEVKNIKSIVLVTADDISKDRRETFDRNLNARENELKEMLQIKPPQKVDFSDKSDEPIRGNMDELLNSAISKREQEMNTVFQDNNLKQKERNTHSDAELDNNETKLNKKTIKIGESLSKGDGKQQVHFETPPLPVVATPSLYDVKEESQQNQTQTQTQTQNQMENVLKLLELINGKQDMILEKLKAVHD